MRVNASLSISATHEELVPRTPVFRVEARPHSGRGEDPIPTALA